MLKLIQWITGMCSKVWLCFIKYFLLGSGEFMVVEEERVNSEAFLNFRSKSVSWLLHKALLFARNGIRVLDQEDPENSA